ncbi:AraC family transcriptional regulator [Leucobacter ruminantium]|uniref:AraC family transcriptional regulator n=1 Tax=Leucobacter ruminantium TaxID=1289170 RepID=A0A939LXK5_9MICO|nr:helix-turn-helix domain-containing protein [Leucobacter ruminantium]MBO1805008.1 AraC family transcriptional regulator [Leucobacter ruminantium]
MDEDRRGILYPRRLPEFHRLAPDPEVEHAVRWFWIPEWDLAPGQESRQELLPFPACNLVVEPQGVTAVGPTTRRSDRVLTGRGWAVGALLRPAAVPALVPSPAAIRDSARPVADDALLARVRDAMQDPNASGGRRRERAVALLSRWVAERVPRPDASGSSDGELANRLADALADPSVIRVDQLPDRVHASTRTLQRTADRFFGLSLHSMIRRRRLQEGAQRLREGDAPTIAALAGELGYSDHAHFTTDFKAVLGVTPSEYRRRAAG